MAVQLQCACAGGARAVTSLPPPAAAALYCAASPGRLGTQQAWCICTPRKLSGHKLGGEVAQATVDDLVQGYGTMAEDGSYVGPKVVTQRLAFLAREPPEAGWRMHPCLQRLGAPC